MVLVDEFDDYLRNFQPKDEVTDRTRSFRRDLTGITLTTEHEGEFRDVGGELVVKVRQTVWNDETVRSLWEWRAKIPAPREASRFVGVRMDLKSADYTGSCFGSGYYGKDSNFPPVQGWLELIGIGKLQGFDEEAALAEESPAARREA